MSRWESGKVSRWEREQVGRGEDVGAGLVPALFRGQRSEGRGQRANGQTG